MKLRVIAGVAFAIAAVAVLCLFGADRWDGDEENTDGIRTFKSYQQIEKVLKDIQESEPMVYAMGVAEDAEIAAENGNEASAKEAEHSDTYLQVDSVDEGDIIKTDGHYIYYTSRLGYDVIIAKASEGKTDEVAVLTEEETGVSADELYLEDRRLMIIGTEYNPSELPYDYLRPLNTSVCIYDVSKPEDPELIQKYTQSGSCISSRISDGYLYLITRDYLGGSEDRIVPMAGCGEEFTKLKPEQICSFPNPSTRSYVVAGSVSIKQPAGKIKTQTRALLGASEDIYCNGNAIYFTDYQFNYDPNMTDEWTSIIRAEINKGNIAFAEKGAIRGHVLNQFSLDEKDGYLRVAATASINGKDVNYLYVLDDRLKTVGKLRGFAAGESIKAVRFMGDTAYVITYEQTDPLFVIDLSDPEKPELLGSVEITGFSSLLVPAGDGKLIGIGMSTSEGEFGETEDGLKIALFDVSDPLEPKVLDSKEYKDRSSDVQYNHKALVVNNREGWYALPYWSWNDETGGVLQFQASGDRLDETADYTGETGIDRCLYIDEYLYGLGYDEDVIISWKRTE
ncbi:MAG: hypothetical protein E7221_06570 [Clostridiales bacterium]|nr:hypothetical protein [Clostridiales bacterium]